MKCLKKYIMDISRQFTRWNYREIRISWNALKEIFHSVSSPLQKIMEIRAPNYYNEKTRDFKWKKMPDEVDASFSGKSSDSVVSVVSRVHQTSNTLIYLTLKFSCGSSLPYMVCLYLWLTGRKCIQNKKLTAESG